MVQTTGNSSESAPVSVDKQSSIESNDSLESSQMQDKQDALTTPVTHGNQLRYLDFEVEIGCGKRHRYPVAVLNSPSGEAAATMNWPFTHASLEEQLAKIDDVLLRASARRRKRLDPSEKTIQEFGANLFDALIAGEMRSLYDVSREKAFQQNCGLRIKLRISEPRLVALPWEYMYDKRQDHYIGLSNRTPVVRYLETPHPPRPLITTGPLRILGMASNPNDGAPINSSREKRRVEMGLQHLIDQELIELKWVDGATWRDLQRELLQGPWHIFHFIGHGYFDQTQDQGYVVLSDDDGSGDCLSATRLGHLLADHHHLRLVVLNACDGAKSSARDTLSSSASILVKQGISAVLAMQNEISNRAAVECARSFYQSIAYGFPIDAAAADARKGISLEDRDSPEWGTPVLYMRSPDGLLLQSQSPSGVPSREECPPSTGGDSAGISMQALLAHRPRLRAADSLRKRANKTFGLNGRLESIITRKAETRLIQPKEKLNEQAILDTSSTSNGNWNQLTLSARRTARKMMLATSRSHEVVNWFEQKTGSSVVNLRYMLAIVLGLGLFSLLLWFTIHYLVPNIIDVSIEHNALDIQTQLAVLAPIAWGGLGISLLFITWPVLSSLGRKIAAIPLLWACIWFLAYAQSSLLQQSADWPIHEWILPQNIYICIGLIAAGVSLTRSQNLVSLLLAKSGRLSKFVPTLLTILGTWFMLDKLSPIFVTLLTHATVTPIAPIPNAEIYSSSGPIVADETQSLLSSIAYASQWATSIAVTYFGFNAHWAVTGQWAPSILVLLATLSCLAIGIGTVAFSASSPISFPAIVAGLLTALFAIWSWIFEKPALYRQLCSGVHQAADQALMLIGRRGMLTYMNAGTQLQGGNLCGLDLSDLSLDEFDFKGASLVGTNLTDTNLRHSDFRFANLSEASLERANLGWADLRHTNMKRTIVTDLVLVNAIYNEKTIWPDGYDYRRSGAIGPNAILKHRSLRHMNFATMDLAGINFTETDLAHTNFSGADLSRASFRGANLVGADLSEIRYKNATFIGAMYDETTRWPERFDPVKRGAELRS